MPADDLRAVRQRLRDYAKIGLELFSQRMVIYSAAILLAGVYYSWKISLIFFALVCLCEAFDLLVFRGIVNCRSWTESDVRRAMSGIYFGTAFSSATIASFAVSFAFQQGHEEGHLMPVFMLISASIFAAMNNNQFLPVLALRLLVYISAIIYIPAYDVVATSAPVSSVIWLNFFTVIFVLGFLLELARTFLAGYSTLLKNRVDLREEVEHAKMAYIAKTEFLATVSHELRTPLTSIKGALDIINSGAVGKLPKDARRPLQIASKNTNRLATLVDDLLLLQSADAGRLNFEFAVIDVGRLVLQVVEQFRPYSDRLNASFRTETIAAKFYARASETRIEQVLTNLLSNAAKFSKESGEVLISVDSVDDCIRVSVADNGIGIPYGSEDLVFEEFSQLDSSSSRKFEGTGLGMAISKRIIDAHGGRIYYESEPGRGTTFFVELPEANALPELEVPQEPPSKNS